MSPGDEMAAVLVLLSALRTFWMLIIAVFLALWGIHHSDICPAVVRDGVRYGKLVPSAGAAGNKGSREHPETPGNNPK